MKLSVKSGKLNKIHIYIDDEYRFTVDSDFWLSEKWHNLKEIDENELAALESAVSFRRAFNTGLNLLSYRAHGKKELIDKLVMKKHDRQSAEAAADRLEELHLIDDGEFAQRLAEELIRKKGYSLKRVRQELLRRGIDRETAEQAVELLDKNEQMRIIELIEKKYYRWLGDEKGRKKVFNSLLRLGYSYGDINSALREFEENEV